MLTEKDFVRAKTMTDIRNKKFVFATHNSCKIGFSITRSRFRSVSNMTEKEWMRGLKETFKLRAKNGIIQSGQEQWRCLLCSVKH